MRPRALRLRGHDRLAEAVLESLGELERKALAAVWEHGESSVADVGSWLGNIYAYTTVMTTLDRLYKKGILTRRRRGRAFLYRSDYSIEELERSVARDVIAKLLETSVGQARPVLSCIVESVSERDHELLDELEVLVREKRAQLDREEKGL